jgi:hypothetical protein
MIARPEVHQDPAAMGNLVGLRASLGIKSAWVDWGGHVLAAALLVAAPSPGAAIATGLLVGRHSYLQDFALLLFAYALAAESMPSVAFRVACQLLLMPFLYLALLAGPPWSAALPLALLAVLAVAGRTRRRLEAPDRPPVAATGCYDSLG